MFRIFSRSLSSSSETYVRHSDQFLLGRKKIGMVVLPEQVDKKIQKFAKGWSNEIKQDYQKLLQAMRSRNNLRKLAELEEVKKARPFKLEYGDMETLAYTSFLFPETYGVQVNVFNEIKKRMPDFAPQSVLDFGCGSGAGIWAFNQTFGESANEYCAVDASNSMISMAEALKGESAFWDKVKFQVFLSGAEKKHDLVVSAFTLDELHTAEYRNSTIDALWAACSDTLVLVDYGTAQGYNRIIEMRKRILQKGDVHVVAPCPHDGVCPLENKKSTWCMYSQRIRLSSLNMRLAQQAHNFKDVDYCYLVLRRGPRPTIPVSVHEESFQWKRLIREPLRRDKHVILDYCAPTGELLRSAVTKKGPDRMHYRDAKEARQGDLWPHEAYTKEVGSNMK